MSPEDAIEAFKQLAKTDVLADMLLDRDPVHQLTELVSYLKRVDAWLVQSREILAAGPNPEFESTLAKISEMVIQHLPRTIKMLDNAIKKRDKAGGPLAVGIIKPMSLDNDPAASCIDKQQEINRDTLSALSEADSLSERLDAIKDWGRDTTKNLGECIETAFGQFDGKDQPEDANP